MKQLKNNNPRECTICGKPFASGKAMGGHMRAHYASHPIPPAAITKKKAVENSAESVHNQGGENFMLNSSASSESSSQWKSPTGTRSKRRRKFMATEPEAEAKEAEEEQPVSSISDPEVEHAAEILLDIQFARRWRESQEVEMSRRSTELTTREPRVSVNLVEGQEDNIQLNEFHNEEEARVLVADTRFGLFPTLIGATRTGSRFKCETCNKTFRSHLALSLHNEEDARVRGPNMPLGLFPPLIGATRTGSRFKCETCNKTFRSHQALSLHNEEEARVRAPDMPLGLFPPLIAGTRTESRFKTETCNQTFRSHQTLSFHSESHKEVRSEVEDGDYEDDDSGSGGNGGSVNDALEDEKRHQCPVCFKVFTSGQGLGGHKRIHMANAAAGKGNKPSAAKKLRPTLDLNVPAPELEEEVISIDDLSTSSSDQE